MSDSLAPVILAVALRTMNWPWLELQIVARSSAATLTRHACGSMYPWWTGLVLKCRSMTTSASAKPSSTSPSVKAMRLATLVGASGAESSPSVRRNSCTTGASALIASSTSMTQANGS